MADTEEDMRMRARAGGGAATATLTGPPPGWYADPSDPTTARYWNGLTWMESFANARGDQARPHRRGRTGRRAAIIGGTAGSIAILLTAAVIAASTHQTTTAKLQSVG